MEACDNLKVFGHCSAKEDCCPNSHFKYISTTSYSGDSTNSIGSESSSELFDDASSSSSSSSSLSTCSSPEPHLHHGYSEPMEPKHKLKRGLSKYYQGKARTFTSLSDVRCVEDLAKKEIPFMRKSHRTSHHPPKATIVKKNTRGSANSLVSKSLACSHRKCSNDVWFN